MSIIFSLIAIFALVAIFFFISLRVIDLVFDNQTKFKAPLMKSAFTTSSFLVWFIFGLGITFILSTVLVDRPLSTERPKQYQAIVAPSDSLNQDDCSKVIDTIYITENQIYQVENHRYIEEASPTFTIKVDYKKGSEKLKAAASEYRGLEVNEETLDYTMGIAQQLDQKASLFTKRAELTEESKNIKEAISLLEQMDLVTEQRQGLINAVERQCSS